MPGRLAIDFGTSNTVVALWDEARREGVPQHIPDYGQVHERPGGEPISVVPSLIHYAPDGRRWIGSQVTARGLQESERTFRWMKRYIAVRSPARPAASTAATIGFAEAGSEFLTPCCSSPIRSSPQTRPRSP